MSLAESVAGSPSALPEYRPGVFALRDAWFPLLHESRAREGRVVRRAIHGQPVFLWREGKQVHAAADSAAIETGRCAPTEFTLEDGHYPVVQRYGFAWVWYGAPANAGPELVPQVPDDILSYPCGLEREFRYDCTYELICENVLDTTHVDFLHAKFGGGAVSDGDEVFVESTSETVSMTRIATGRKVPRFQRLTSTRAKTQDLRFTFCVHVRSGLLVAHASLDPGLDVRALLPANPVSPYVTHAPFTLHSSLPSLARTPLMQAIPILVRQDNWAVRKQNHGYLEGGFHPDLSSRFDKAVLRYRKTYRELVARQMEGDYAYRDHPTDSQSNTGPERIK